jgi:hypothetical protein
MGWLGFWSSLIGSIAWPLAVCAIAFFFRSELKSLLKALKFAKGAGIEVQFEKQSTALAVEVKQIAPDPELTLPAKPAEFTAAALRAYWAQSRDDRPAALITESWNQVFTVMRDLYDAVVPRSTPTYGDPSQAIFELKASGWITAELSDVLMRMLSMRNTVAHVAGFEPTEAAAREYQESAVKMAYTLSSTLERARENAPRD